MSKCFFMSVPNTMLTQVERSTGSSSDLKNDTCKPLETFQCIQTRLEKLLCCMQTRQRTLHSAKGEGSTGIQTSRNVSMTGAQRDRQIGRKIEYNLVHETDVQATDRQTANTWAIQIDKQSIDSQIDRQITGSHNFDNHKQTDKTDRQD